VPALVVEHGLNYVRRRSCGGSYSITSSARSGTVRPVQATRSPRSLSAFYCLFQLGMVREQ
jgi:hypothetical protein